MKYKTKEYQSRFAQYVSYLRQQLRKNRLTRKLKLSELTDQELVVSCQNCRDCGIQFFSETDLKQAVMEFETPENTLMALQTLADEAHIKEHLNQSDWIKVDVGEDVWSFDRIPQFKITPEMRQKALTNVAEMFRVWVKNGPTFNLESDPSNSNVLIEVETDGFDRLVTFETLGEWAEACYTGDKINHENKWLYVKFEHMVNVIIIGTFEEFWTKNITPKEFKRLKTRFYKSKDGKVVFTDYVADMVDLAFEMSCCEAYAMI